MTTRIGVVADVRRRDEDGEIMGEVLASKVGAEVISIDDGMLGHTNHSIKVWTNLAQRGGDWAVVLEDDAKPVDGFREQLDMALANAPSGVVSLYLGQGYPTAWQRFIKKAVTNQRANYVVSTHVLHSVALAIRVELINDMLRFISWLSDEDKKWPFDEQVTHWARQRGNDVVYTWPSLVDHADGESLIHHPEGQGSDGIARVAWKVGTRKAWNKFAVVNMP